MTSGDPVDPSDPAGSLARFLRQRLEAGTDEVFLQDLDRDRLFDLVERIRTGTAASASQRAGEAPGRGEARDGGAGDASSERFPAGGSGETPAAPADASDEASAGEDVDDVKEAVRTGGAGEETIRSFDYETLRDVAMECRRCGLAEERKQVVFSDGSRDARLMVVGEAPGAREDATGLPFVGPAGKLLDLLLAAVDLSREESVYICNVIKCRPPGNRNPLPGEIEACAPYLRRQIELVSPGAILAVGTFAGRLLTGRDSTLGNLRGDVYSYEGVPLLVTYHPAALLRNRRWVRSTWDDLQLLRDVLDGTLKETA